MAGSNFSLAFEVYRTPIWMMRPDLFLHYKGIMEMARMTQEYDTEWEDQKQHPSLLVYSKITSRPKRDLSQELKYLIWIRIMNLNLPIKLSIEFLSVVLFSMVMPHVRMEHLNWQMNSDMPMNIRL